MIEVINRQRKVPVDPGSLREFAELACCAVDEARGCYVTVVLVSDDRIRKLNAEFRSKDTATDVLSFPLGDETEIDSSFLGDIVISAETARKQAVENDLGFETELKQLILHGILHLAGYDHETDDGEMDALEMKYRKALKIEV